MLWLAMSCVMMTAPDSACGRVILTAPDSVCVFVCDRLLVGRGADVEARDSDGCTLLHAAATGGNPDIVR